MIVSNSLWNRYYCTHDDDEEEEEEEEEIISKLVADFLLTPYAETFTHIVIPSLVY